MQEPEDRTRQLPPATFPPWPERVAAVRHLVEDFLEGRVEADLVEVAALLVSELSTNAVLHAGTDFTISASLAPEVLRVEVQDHSCTLPELHRPSPSHMTGRGLWAVDRLASRWAAEPTDGGKVVWFELPVQLTARW